jgi:hypothetical protein
VFKHNIDFQKQKLQRGNTGAPCLG